jgi:hypothetical protein
MLLDILEDGDYRLLTAIVGGEDLIHNAEIERTVHSVLLYIGAKLPRKILFGKK